MCGPRAGLSNQPDRTETRPRPAAGVVSRPGLDNLKKAFRIGRPTDLEARRMPLALTRTEGQPAPVIFQPWPQAGHRHRPGRSARTGTSSQSGQSMVTTSMVAPGCDHLEAGNQPEDECRNTKERQPAPRAD